ncbi:MAG TPA: hypothetical protein VFC53_12480 [Dehalococcoidia bacterium]|jgi:hypothetical protein|nr:hypothetical protein [Dehalococcoidia bacterium]
MTAQATALRALVRKRDYEAIAAWLLLAVAVTARTVPPESIDELLALLAGGEARDGREP